MPDRFQPLNIMIVDDELSIRQTLKFFLENIGHTVCTHDGASSVMNEVKRTQPDLLVLDIRLPGKDGIDLMSDILKASPEIEIILMTGYGTMETVIQALRIGASDFLRKPINLEELEATVEKTCRLIAYKTEQRRLHGALNSIQSHNHPERFLENMVGDSHSTEMLKRQIKKVAHSHCQNVLIVGETGTGKEVVAHLLHNLRSGPKAPFIAVNCGAIPESLVESELFGHRKGAFTGATEERMGAFALAHNGTLFLDELSDLSASAQAKLLRALETRKIRQVGGSREHEVDAMVVAASNRDLEERIAAGKFRSDLYYRLNTFVLQLSPLRDRPEDIMPLVRHFLDNSSAPQAKLLKVAPEVERLLIDYTFPGNVRELRSIVDRAIMLCDDDLITEAHLTIPRPSTKPTVSDGLETSTAKTVRTTAQTEAEETLAALRRTGWNMKKAAAHLAISYSAIRWRVKKYDLKCS